MRSGIALTLFGPGPKGVEKDVTALQINVLGPLSVHVGQIDMTPTAPKPRRVLALLAICANRVVRNEQIIEELWENSPPTSVTTTLQTYVYQLRKHLQRALAPQPVGTGGSVSGSDLRTFAGGYMLSLAPEALDSLRFEQLVAQGRAALESGRTETAARILREALALWRGPALVDVTPGPILQVEVLRLEEMSKSALELRIEADLLLGRHHELLSELVGLSARQPTHEGFQAKLMLALYRAGRRSEALGVYQGARKALVAELGVDPSGDLQRLHRAILEGDPSLSEAGPPPIGLESLAMSIPRQRRLEHRQVGAVQ
ncbi:AfsR/SARP family transcriptional regulator [Micromonospora echinospora]|uniref:AfsR/SARP family transcriptional regulator n=1 Tax=Micromonospora echinospora TaxID=1877 RepID=UPI0033D6EC39